MKVGFVGLGKLGLPVALAVESKGHEVVGYDINPKVKDYLTEKRVPFKEEGIEELLANNKIALVDSVSDLVAQDCDLIFVPIQTPHDPQFEGASPMPDDRKDFNYEYLVKGIQEISDAAYWQDCPVKIVVISTCLPGTFNREIRQHLNDYTSYIYNPFFIAMGTAISDFLDPEFVLLGVEDKDTFDLVKEFYSTIHDKPLFPTDITTAEGIKVFYNTFITMKTVLANVYGEMADRLGMNVDDIYEALSMATERIISPKYLKAGMGDGGGCHPRDNIALSYIAERCGLSFDIFETLIWARESHAQWLAEVAAEHSYADKPLVLLGKAFKPETNIQTGSPALLVAHYLTRMGIDFNHVEDALILSVPATYFIATQHSHYRGLKFVEGSTVIDPFGYIPDQDGVEVIRLGRRNVRHAALTG